jgi:hypothetical protein
MIDENTQLEDESLTPDETDTTIDTSAADAAAADAASKVSEPSALDVISSAIEEVGKPRQITPKQDEQDQSDTRPRNADGTFKTETAEEKTAREAADAAAILAKETPEQKAAREAAETPEQKATREAEEAKVAAKKPDAINDPIPEGLNKRTAERMKTLIETVKAQESAIVSHTELFNAVREAGTPDEFAGMLSYMRGVKSSDPKVLEQALAILQSELRGLAVRMGKPLYEVNLLRDPTNQDLVDDIRDGKLSNDRAHELALQRESRKQQGHVKTRETDEQRATAEHTQGTNELNALEKQLIVRDGFVAYKAKRDILESTLAATMESVSPTKWKAIFTKAYEGLKITPPAVAAVTPVVPKPQPQRPKQPAGGGGAAAPKSALEAVNAALGQ